MKRVYLFVLLFALLAFASPALADGPTPPEDPSPPPCDPLVDFCPDFPYVPYPTDMSGPDGEIVPEVEVTPETTPEATPEPPQQGTRRARVRVVTSKFGRVGIIVR